MRRVGRPERGGEEHAGKSTAAPFLLSDAMRLTRFLNADTIARGLSAYEPDDAATRAGRILLDAMDDYAAAGLDFATETTLSGRSLANRLRKLKRDRGYAIRLHYLWVPGAEYSVNRVALRVSRGGHAIPPEVCRRRYGMSLDNFFRRYAPLPTGGRCTIVPPSRSTRSRRGRAKPSPASTARSYGMNSTSDTAPSANGEAALNGHANGRVREPDRETILAALRASADHARGEARLHGEAVVGWRDGRCVWETADGEEVTEPDWAKRFRETGEKPPVLHRRVG